MILLNTILLYLVWVFLRSFSGVIKNILINRYAELDSASHNTDNQSLYEPESSLV
jgi:hypothetical protein